WRIKAGCDVARVIAIANQKGGVGKTTTAINLSAALAIAQKETLVVDCDPQANATGGLGFPKDPARRSIYNCLLQKLPLESIMLKYKLEHLFLILTDKHLVAATVEIIDLREREQVLRRKLDPVRVHFEFILLNFL